jgi:hypothetical protein
MKLVIKIMGIILLGIILFNVSIYVFNIVDAWVGIALSILSGFGIIFLFLKSIETEKNRFKDEED